jgi:hypothetical protein
MGYRRVHDRDVAVLRIIMRLERDDQGTRRIDSREAKGPDQESHKK